MQNLTLRNELASTVEDSRRAQIVLRQQLQSTMQRQLDGCVLPPIVSLWYF